MATFSIHVQAAYPLHWPLVNSDHMRTKLAKQELEKKRIEDDHRWQPFCPSTVVFNALLLRPLAALAGAVSVVQAACCISVGRQRRK